MKEYNNELITNNNNNLERVNDKNLAMQEAMSRAYDSLKKDKKKRGFFKAKLKRFYYFIMYSNIVVKLLAFVIMFSLITTLYFIANIYYKPKEFANYIKKHEFILDNIDNRTNGKDIIINENLIAYLITNKEDINAYKKQTNKYSMYLLRNNKVKLQDGEYIALFNKGDNIIEFRSGIGNDTYYHPNYTPSNNNKDGKLYLKLTYEYNYLDSIQKYNFDKKLTKHWLDLHATNGVVIEPEYAKNLMIIRDIRNKVYDIDDINTKINVNSKQVIAEIKRAYVYDVDGYWQEFFDKEFPKNLMYNFTKYKLLKMEKRVDENLYDENNGNIEIALRQYVKPYVKETYFESDDYKEKIEKSKKIQRENEKYIIDVINQVGR